MMIEPDTKDWLLIGAPTRGRSCGSCKACCTQMPVVFETNVKPANTRCQYLKSSGCGVYKVRPTGCKVWSCRWLFDPATANLVRPDLSGYIVDSLDQLVTKNDKGERRIWSVLQIWIDPKRRDAHRAPELRDYLANLAYDYGILGLVRWNSTDGMLLVAPDISGKGEWIEMEAPSHSRDRLAREVERAMA